MASVSRQIGWSQESNLLYQILNQLTRLTSIIFGLKPKYKVFTALLTQSGVDSPNTKVQGDTLDLGVTYYIDVNSENADLTIFGAPNSSVGTYFICTQVGVLPTIGTISLVSNLGAPVAIVLDNTIGNIWFTWEESFRYNINSNELFTFNKTISNIEEPNSYYRPYNSAPSFLKVHTTNNSTNNINLINVLVDGSNNVSSEINSVLINFLLEIKVYS